MLEYLLLFLSLWWWKSNKWDTAEKKGGSCLHENGDFLTGIVACASVTSITAVYMSSKIVAAI